MSVITWRDSYSVGVEKLDEEHKALLRLINEMGLVVRDHRTAGHLAVTINKLIQYTQRHFTSEEKAMAEINYPKLDEHKAIHGKLLHQVTAYKQRIDNHDERAIRDIYHFLKEWLITHIVKEDRQYAPFFADAVAIAA